MSIYAKRWNSYSWVAAFTNFSRLVKFHICFQCLSNNRDFYTFFLLEKEKGRGKLLLFGIWDWFYRFCVQQFDSKMGKWKKNVLSIDESCFFYQFTGCSSYMSYMYGSQTMTTTTTTTERNEEKQEWRRR